MHNIDITTNLRKSIFVPLPQLMLFRFVIKMKPSSKEANEVPKRTYTTLDKRKIWERANSYLENNQVSKVEWWRRFRAAVCKTHELQARYLEIYLTILNENCWSTDKNMCNIGKMTNVLTSRLIPLSLKDPIPIWPYNATILKGSYWRTDKNIHDIGKTRNFEKRLCTLEITTFPE